MLVEGNPGFGGFGGFKPVAQPTGGHEWVPVDAVQVTAAVEVERQPHHQVGLLRQLRQPTGVGCQ